MGGAESRGCLLGAHQAALQDRGCGLGTLSASHLVGEDILGRQHPFQHLS